MNDQPDHLPFAVEVSAAAGELDKQIAEMHKFILDNWPTSQARVSRRGKDRDSIVYYFADEATATEFATKFKGQIIKRPKD